MQAREGHPSGAGRLPGAATPGVMPRSGPP